MSFWQWILDNPTVISAGASTATLLVWLLYLQLFYNSYRRQTRSKIMITRGGGRSLHARCVITNMSPEIVFVGAIVLELTYENETQVCSLSDVEHELGEGRDWRSQLYQGPLASGEYLDIGSFHDLLSAGGSQGRDAEIDPPREIRIIVAGNYTWHDKLVAAERSFETRRLDGGQIVVEPKERSARQVHSRRGRAKVLAILDEQAGAGASPCLVK